ncbi:nuclear protein MDM1 isoform X2 [Brienomyrus brachyistius]|uniref:nuclear protein MDM1 isoform X2 n=1 Tax=Brienomyrus brachyistius TaxID=42636 RepID=UPI0020B2DC43|nr:nuclear protein MDM1 isoform X2 [Brienomyrus brachyistius]
MKVHFKGVSEYQSKFKGQRVKRRSVSPQCEMRQAGLRSDQSGITREPHFLSKKAVPFYEPQVPKSLQWEVPVDPRGEPRTREVCRPKASFADPPVEKLCSPQGPETPLAPRGPKPSEGQCAESKPEPPPPEPEGSRQANGPPATVDKAEVTLNGIQRALRRKAALRTAEQRPGRQASEYQRQFTWKMAACRSPLLAAEQMVYSSNRMIPPFKTNPVVMESEYRKNFKGAQPPRGPRLRQELDGREGALLLQESVCPVGSAKGKRKVNRGQRYRKPRQQNGSATLAGEKRPQEVRSSKRHQRSTPHSGCWKGKSEYISNFRSPQLYRYKDGVWIKASATGEEGCDSDHAHMWYDEVRELRERAEAYRRRARGTHFSRDHLNQILSEQNGLWEASTVTSSVGVGQNGSVTGLDLPSADSENGNIGSVAAPTPPDSRRSSKVEEDPDLQIRRRLAWGEAEKGGEPEREEEAEEEEEVKINKGNGTNKHDPLWSSLRLPERRHLSPPPSSEGFVPDGRLPTPKLADAAVAQRTHHDLTTPITGGAILVSPPTLKGFLQGVRRCDPPLGKTYNHFKPLSHTSTPPEPGKADDDWAQTQAHVAGLSTEDPIPLREDVLPVGAPPPDRPVRAPHHSRWPWKHSATACPAVSAPANRIQGTLRDPEFQHNGNLGTIRPEPFLFQSSDSTTSDDDRMSQISSRSAESCTLASQVLARAQKRREEFWGNT